MNAIVSRVNPDDPDRKGSGTPYADLMPEPAIEACEKAVQLQPHVTRLKYQLARAHQKARRWDQAHKLLGQLVGVLIYSRPR